VEDLLLALLAALADGLFEALIELALEALFSTGERHPPFEGRAGGAFALILCGAVGGAVFTLLAPDRLIQLHAYIPGTSLLIAPLVAGACMHFLGEWRRRTGHKPTMLATFAGGATFAFGMALARLLMVGLK